MLIDDGNESEIHEEALQRSSESPMRGSKISYFQKSSPKEKKESQLESSRKREQVDSGSQEIKKLLESLIASKAEF